MWCDTAGAPGEPGPSHEGVDVGGHVDVEPTHGFVATAHVANQGKGTSDLDVTLVGSKVMEAWNSDAYYIPGLHTKPLCDKDPDIAPSLNPLRESLQKLVGRPVNMQATSSLVLYGRDVLFGEPYFEVVPPGEAA